MASERLIAAMFELLGEIWKKEVREMSPRGRAVYARMLRDIPDAWLEAGLSRLLSEATFFPKPAEIRAACLSLVEDNKPSGLEAWGMLQRYIRRWPAGGRWVAGKHLDPPPLPPHVARAVQAVGGLAMLRASEHQAADRARFVEAYDRLLDQERTRLFMLPEVRETLKKINALASLAQIEQGSKE
jgi:hypothetical protein